MTRLDRVKWKCEKCDHEDIRAANVTGCIRYIKLPALI
jgi:hypothetical protein